MTNKKSFLAGLLSISTAIIISSCGSAGDSNVGQGGPEVSPEEYTNLGAPAVDTANTALIGTTTPEEGTVVENIVDVKIEGSLDTNSGDTGLADAEVILAGAVSEEAISVVADTVASSGTTNDTTQTTLDSASSSDTAADTGQADSTDTSAAGTGQTTSSDTAAGTDKTVSTDTASGTTNTTGGTDTAVTETATTTTDTGVSEGTGSNTPSDIPLVSGNVVNALENDEAVNQNVLDYALDSSGGRWYEETKKELFSESEAKGIKAEIKKLREEIKSILASYKNKDKEKDGDKDKDKDKDGDKDRKEAKGKIKQIREKIAALRAKIGNGGRMQAGIYTNWANENLKLKIKSGEPGWYRVIIVAKNRGKLPENYDRFTFSVNDSGNDAVAGISVKASDTIYHRGSADIKIDKPAGTTLNIVWTNEAYMKDKYDVNVNIKKVVLKKIKEPREKVVNVKHLNGDEFSFMDGRWFFDNKAAYTFWANQIIGYTFKNMEEGEYEVTITAKNYDSLPLEKNYKEFNLEIDSDYDSASMNIKASDKSWNHETVKMNFAEGDNTLYINWTNDLYKEKNYDSNIMIKSISIKKVHKSSLTAFLLKTKPGNKVFILGAFLMLSGLIFGIYLKNKNTKEA